MDIDRSDACRGAILHLFEQGYRKIGMVCSARNYSSVLRRVELPLPAGRDFRLYSELAFETVAQNGDAAVTVELQAAWPEYSEVVKKRIKLDKGTTQHKFTLPNPGYRTELRKLVLTFHQEPGASDEKKRSALTAPIEFRNLRLNAVDDCMEPLEKQLEDALTAALSVGDGICAGLDTCTRSGMELSVYRAKLGEFLERASEKNKQP